MNKYDFRSLEKMTTTELDELETELWKTQKIIRSIIEYRKCREQGGLKWK